jgi:hypothetical protein
MIDTQWNEEISNPGTHTQRIITERRIVRESTVPENRGGKMWAFIAAFSRYILISG